MCCCFCCLLQKQNKQTNKHVYGYMLLIVATKKELVLNINVKRERDLIKIMLKNDDNENKANTTDV